MASTVLFFNVRGDSVTVGVDCAVSSEVLISCMVCELSSAGASGS